MSEQDEEKSELRKELDKFIRKNFPQISMHGGSFGIQELNEEEGFVRINLGGACSGCGISPMTVSALKNRIPKEIDEIERVEAGTMGGGSGTSITGRGEMKMPESSDREDEQPEAPF